MEILVSIYKQYSHILPIIDIINGLKIKGQKINICSSEHLNDKGLLDAYSKIYFPEVDKIRRDSDVSEKGVYLLKKVFVEFSESWINFDWAVYYSLEKKFDEKGIDIVIRDALDIYALVYAKRRNLRVITYLTNPAYSLEFLRDNNLIHTYFNLLFCQKFDNLVTSNELYELINEAYSDTFKKYKLEKYLYPFFAQYPKEDENYISSLSMMKSVTERKNDRHYYFSKLSEIDKKMSADKIEHQKCVYISMGSFFKVDIEYMKKIVDYFAERNYSVTLSYPFEDDEERDYLTSVNPQKVYCDRWINQTEILEKVDLFVTAGGMNSIREAISYCVPMFVIPLSNEQNINGYFVEISGCGKSDYLYREAPLSTKRNLDDFLENIDDYRRNLVLTLEKERSFTKKFSISNITNNLLKGKFNNYE